MTLSWTQPICERDWIERNSEWEGDGADERLVSIRQPVRIRYPDGETPPVERCSFCGAPTIFGAYVREDPKVVAFPALKDES